MTLQEWFKDEQNWCQGAMRYGHKKCLLGAIEDFIPSGEAQYEAKRRLSEVIGGSIMCYNDAARSIKEIQWAVKEANL